MFRDLENRRAGPSTDLVPAEPPTILRLHQELQPAHMSSFRDHPVVSPGCHTMSLILGPEFLTWDWSWQFPVPLLKLEYHSLCIYMYVLNNPPPVSIVYFFLMSEEMCGVVHFFCLTQCMTGACSHGEAWGSIKPPL